MAQIYEKKLWIKLIFEKKRGGFTKLMEALSAFGFELTDTSLTTLNGIMLVTFCLQVKKEKRNKEEPLFIFLLFLNPKLKQVFFITGIFS